MVTLYFMPAVAARRIVHLTQSMRENIHDCTRNTTKRSIIFNKINYTQGRS